MRLTAEQRRALDRLAAAYERWEKETGESIDVLEAVAEYLSAMTRRAPKEG